MAIYHATTGDGCGFEFEFDQVRIETPIRIRWDHDDAGEWKNTLYQSADFDGRSAEAVAKALAEYYATGEDDDELTISEIKCINE